MSLGGWPQNFTDLSSVLCKKVGGVDCNIKCPEILKKYNVKL